jgi:polyhydroxyalkanoic acid synthase PhaR subunit
MAEAPKSAPPPDPFAAARQAYEQMSQVWSRTMEQMVSTDEFANASGAFLTRYVELHEATRRTGKATAESLHLPTRDDLAGVAQLVVNVERKLDEVADESYSVARAIDGAGREDGLLARVSALESGLAVVVQRLEALVDRLDAIAGRIAAEPPPGKKTPPRGSSGTAPASPRRRAARPKESS